MVFFPQYTSKLDIEIFPVLFHMNPQTHLYARVCLHRADIIIAISNASHSIVTSWRWIAFFRWLTVFTWIMIIFVVHLYLFRTISLLQSYGRRRRPIFLYIFLNYMRARLNEWMKEFYNLYLHRENSRVKPGMCSPVLDGNYVRRWLSVKDAN